MADPLFYIGVLQLTVVFLSIFAGVIAIRLFKFSKHKDLAAWKYLMIVLLLFAGVEIIGILDAFNIARNLNPLRHVVPSVIMMVIIAAVLKQRESL